MRKLKDTGPRVCAFHNNGDLACDASCPQRLAPSPVAEQLRMEEPVETVDYGPQRCATHVGGMHCPDDCTGRISDSPEFGQGHLEERNTPSSGGRPLDIGVKSTEEMDEAMRDVERRQLEEDEE